MSEKKKLVLKLFINDDKEKQRVMSAVSSLERIDSMNIDKDWKLTVIGDFDTVKVVSKLRKKWNVDIVTLGPAKEQEKKKEEGKKEDDSKKKADDKKKEEEKKKKEDEIRAKLMENYKANYEAQMAQAQAHQHHYVPCTGYYIPHNAYQQYYNYYPSQEENPNSCVIC